jgi:hypothetical protein
VNELNKVALLKDVFLRAYERLVARYATVRQSLGEPDPFRLRLRARLREAIAEVVRARLNRKDAIARIEAWARERIDRSDRKRFVEVVQIELASLHEGNFAPYRIRPSEFEARRKAWQEM